MLEKQEGWNEDEGGGSGVGGDERDGWGQVCSWKGAGNCEIAEEMLEVFYMLVLEMKGAMTQNLFTNVHKLTKISTYFSIRYFTVWICRCCI